MERQRVSHSFSTVIGIDRYTRVYTYLLVEMCHCVHIYTYDEMGYNKLKQITGHYFKKTTKVDKAEELARWQSVTTKVKAKVDYFEE